MMAVTSAEVEEEDEEEEGEEEEVGKEIFVSFTWDWSFI